VVVLLAESFGVPSPSEIILLFAGYLVWQGHLSFPLVVLAGALGSTAGAIGAYQLAYRGGRGLMLTRFRFLFKNDQQLQRWEQYFQTRGDRIIVIGRVISGVRAVISYPAGLFGMPFPRFVLYTAIGAVLWPLIAVSVGYFLGPEVEPGLLAIHRYETPVVIALLAAAAAWWFWRKRRRSRQPQQQD
jgi:membrane protein DedA with SNARE-associated domain